MTRKVLQSNESICICCGALIPEGRQICLKCEKTDDEIEQAFREGLLEGKKTDNRLLTIMQHYGYEVQREIFIEECAEAIQAAQKCKRKGDMEAFKHFREEVADVLIMAEQMRLFLGAAGIDEIVDAKLNRQMRRICDETSN